MNPARRRDDTLPAGSWMCWRRWTPSALRSPLEDNWRGTSPGLWPDPRSRAPQTPVETNTVSPHVWSAATSCSDHESRGLTRDGNMRIFTIFPNGSVSFLRNASSTDWAGNFTHTTLPFSDVWGKHTHTHQDNFFQTQLNWTSWCVQDLTFLLGCLFGRGSKSTQRLKHIHELIKDYLWWRKNTIKDKNCDFTLIGFLRRPSGVFLILPLLWLVVRPWMTIYIFVINVDETIC